MKKINTKISIDLLHRLKQGDAKAFEQIFHAYYSQVYKFVSITSYDKSFVPDITQSVFIYLWENRKQIDTDKNLVNFLYTIAKNKIYRQTERIILQNRFQEHLKEHNSDTICIEEEIHNRFLEKVIFELIEELPDARRKIFLLSRKYGFSNKEIALQLNISEKTVETQIRRSTIYLREQLKHIGTLSLLYNLTEIVGGQMLNNSPL